MSSLSERLKSLGVKIGAHDLPIPQSRARSSIEEILSLHPVVTSHGQSFSTEQIIHLDIATGLSELYSASSLKVLASWSGESIVSSLKPNAFAFLDTETTGLSGGTGTLIFLVGVGRFDGENFRLVQFFLPDPIDEPAHLIAIEQFLAPYQALVTFNGKAFDSPLLNTRYTLHGWISPLRNLASIDLLHLARRLWRNRLPNRTLGNLEFQILGSSRTEEDVPGWAIPQIYADYLRSGNAYPLKQVFYHNAMDVASMALLLNHILALLSNPKNVTVEHGVDIVAMARLYEDIGDLDTAVYLYINALDRAEKDSSQEEGMGILPRPVFLEAIQRLARIHKGRENFTEAVILWEKAAHHHHLHAHIELAMFYEHRMNNYSEAIYWTKTALDLVNMPDFPKCDNRRVLPELQHRLHRLQKKNISNGPRNS